MNRLDRFACANSIRKDLIEILKATGGVAFFFLQERSGARRITLYKLNRSLEYYILPKGARALSMTGRLLVMGDIHGQYGKMVKCLDLAGYNTGKDRLVLLGDYVDRGPDSFRVVAAVIRLVQAGAVALYGQP